MLRRPRLKWRTYWYSYRFDILVMEGFTPEEAALIANCRISSGPVRKLRRQRKRRVQVAMTRGLDHREAIEYVRATVRGTDEEMLDWDTFRRAVYPERKGFMFV